MSLKADSPAQHPLLGPSRSGSRVASGPPLNRRFIQLCRRNSSQASLGVSLAVASAKSRNSSSELRSNDAQPPRTSQESGAEEERRTLSGPVQLSQEVLSPLRKALELAQRSPHLPHPPLETIPDDLEVRSPSPSLSTLVGAGQLKLKSARLDGFREDASISSTNASPSSFTFFGSTSTFNLASILGASSESRSTQSTIFGDHAINDSTPFASTLPRSTTMKDLPNVKGSADPMTRIFRLQKAYRRPLKWHPCGYCGLYSANRRDIWTANVFCSPSCSKAFLKIY